MNKRSASKINYPTLFDALQHRFKKNGFVQKPNNINDSRDENSEKESNVYEGF